MQHGDSQALMHEREGKLDECAYALMLSHVGWLQTSALRSP
jgi:hypothetical protein